MSQVPEYKLQQHLYYVFSTAENTSAAAGGNIIVNTQKLSFPAKKIKINWAYMVNSNTIVNYIITSPNIDNEVVGNLCNYSYTDAGLNTVSTDCFRQDNVIEHVFPEPKNLSGSITFSFQDLNGAAINAARFVVHIEALA